MPEGLEHGLEWLSSSPPDHRILIRRRPNDRHRLLRPPMPKPILVRISVKMETERLRLVKDQLAVRAMRVIDVTDVRERDGVSNVCVTAAHDHNDYQRLGDCCEDGPKAPTLRVLRGPQGLIEPRP